MPSTGVLKVSPKVVTFDDDQYQEPKEVPEAKAVKPSSKARAKRAPSGLSNRTKTADDANSLGPKTSKKNFSEATKVIASLSKRCGGYRTIHVGHLRGHIGNDQQETIARRINDAVGILNRASPERIPLIEVLWALRSTHKDAWVIAIDPGATCIVGAVTYDPNHPNQRRNLAVTTKCLAEPERRYRDWLEADKPGESMGRKLPDGKKVIVAIGMCDFSSTQSRHVMFIRGYLEHDERPAYLKPPPKDKNTASKRKVDEGGDSTRYTFSYLLPSIHTFSYRVFDERRLIITSNKCLFDLLFDIPSFQKIVREVAGVGLNATKMVIRAALMKNPSKGRLLDEVFLLPPEMLAKSKYVLDNSQRRYVRTSSFKTNGLVLSLLWIDTTGKPPLPDRKVEDAINLPNIFSNKSLQSNHQDAWIIALDPGATCIVGAVAYDPNHPNQRRNLAVTTKCLAEPERRYRDWLEADKPGESMGRKLPDGKKVIVAIGMCDFSSTQSRHVMFIRYLIRKLRPLGYTIVGVNEYYTSKKCPCCTEFVEMPAMRRLYCRGCNKWYHRDVMAADNMVNIVRGYLEHDERPAYLKPPPKDKNTASKRKVDEGGTSRGGPSKSRKTR
ncbi:hypothetical protein SeMB42_g04997 [Synchytrium endobioticum]|uniref:Cas12f1-like TNB domain-containing protein n=1 Tax=Synchytrium endobioticum TaxID=286115 RepID=A0A507CUR5_9FUNG|nr:hypothetical protein SeMB42_g04997 [Synchytrium endobioticum]